MIGEGDERPHAPSDGPTWSESYDVAWLSPDRFGFTSIAGLEHHVTADDGPGAAVLLRERAEDLFL